MKRIMSNKIYQKVILGGLILTLVLGMVVLMPSLPAYAAGQNPQSTAQPQTANSNAALENAYQREQQALSNQSDQLTKANAAVTKAQDIINKAKSQGKDVSALEAGLATFQAQVSAAQASHNTAAQVLGAHLGFDANGKVTEPAAARQTVLVARQSLASTRQTLLKALADLRSTIKNWRDSIRGLVQDTLLEKAYTREQKALTDQANNLSKAGSAAAKAQDLINQAKSNGKDVSALQAALDTFQSQLTSAKSSNTAAGVILSKHAGFDGNGKVTDRTVARQTILDVKQSITQARMILINALHDLQRAIKDWRQSNRPTTTPAPTAQP